MFHKRTSLQGRSRKLCILAQALLLMAVPAVIFSSMRLGAQQLTNRSVNVATSTPNAVTSHTFRFTITSSSAIGSIQFEYCSNDPFVGAPCTAPAGLSVGSATIGSQAGETGFSIHPNSSVNNLILTRPSSAVTPQSATYVINNIQNPSSPSTTTFVRVSTYASTDATGSRTDEGSVLFSTSGSLGTQGYVPPYLTFCVGITVAPNCTTATGNSLDLGELSSTRANAATSQFAGATNDVNGFLVSLAGTTMTSGNNIINPVVAPTGSSPGTSQFGINLRANTIPAVGQNPLGSGTSAPTADFNNPNQFVFKNGTLTVSPISTDFNTFTVSYLVNVPKAQPPGVYSTTATYIATALF